MEREPQFELQTQPQQQSGPSKRTVSLAIAIILLIVGIGAGTAIGYFGVSRLTGNSALCTSGQTLTIGELLDLSQDLSSQGKRAQASSKLAIQDTYGTGLANATSSFFTYLGGSSVKVIDTIFYPTDTTDFSTYLSTLNTDFNNNVGTYGAGHIAIDVIAFEEFGSFILKAQSSYNTAFPWSTLPWFGTDGEAQDSVIVNATYGGAVSQVKLPSTLYAQSDNSKTLALIDAFKAANPSLICDSYCLGAYDDMWLAALATLQAGVNDGAKIQAAMLTVAQNYFGVQGWDGMQASGDLIPSSYQIWKVVSSNWVFAGTWTPALPTAAQNTDTLSWTSPP